MLRKKGLCLLLGVMLLIPFAVPALAATATNYVTYYVVTADKGPLNVRSSPIAPANNVIGSLQYGASVTVVSFTQDRSWAIIIYGKQNAYVMTRYLNAVCSRNVMRGLSEIHHACRTPSAYC